MDAAGPPSTCRSEVSSLGAYWLPFTANRAFKANPRLIVSASGTRYRTDDGRELLDGMSGLWCCNAGHSHPRIVEAIRRQAAELDYAMAFQVGHPTAFELAGRLAAMAPAGLDAVFFTNSGSESVDTALKIALAYHHARGEHSRTRFVGRERGYHGAGFGGMSVGGIANNRKAFSEPNCRASCICRRPTISSIRPSVGASRHGVPISPMSWNASSRSTTSPPSRRSSSNPSPDRQAFWCRRWGYLERLREITERHGILLIFDEVITAFGRLGAGFGADRFGVVPDIITTAKGITSGSVPMGAVSDPRGNP